MTKYFEERANHLVTSILSQRTALDEAAKRIRTPEIAEGFDKMNHDCWCLAATGDSLVKLRLFVEQNFNFIETMGIICVARYIFELSVWLKLFKLDSRYGLVYYAKLQEAQRRYWQDQRNQIHREISLLKKFGNEEDDMFETEISKIDVLSENEAQQKEAYNISKTVTDFIDRKAARHFSIFIDQARVNGYNGQAYLIQEQIVPEIDRALAEINSETEAFKTSVSKDVQDLISKLGNWREMAKKVGMVDEYDYIYTFSSRLLHATPASITTDQKNLELPELVVFLKFIDVKIHDALELASEYSEDS